MPLSLKEKKILISSYLERFISSSYHILDLANWPCQNLPTVAQAGDITAPDIETSYRQTDSSVDLQKKW